MTRFRLINWWISKNLNTFHFVLCFVGICMCLAGIFAERPSLTVWGERGLLLLLFIHLIHEVLNRFQQYLETCREVDRIPVVQMKQVTGFYLVVFLLGLLILIWIGGFLPWKQIGGFICGIVLTGIRWLVGLIPKSERAEVVEETLRQEPPGVPALPVGETSALAMILDKVLYVLFWIVFAAVLVWGFYHVVRRISRWMGTLNFDGDEKTFLEPESVREKSSETNVKLLGLRNRVKQILDRSVEGSIRGLYRKYVVEQMAVQQEKRRYGIGGRRKPERGSAFGGESNLRRKTGVGCEANVEMRPLAYMTPAEVECRAGFDPMNETWIRMHEIYEKARYSESGCGGEELKEMRQWEKQELE